MAGTIDQLNFEVILNDRRFLETVERDLATAEKLNTQLSKILDLKKQLDSQTTKQIVNAEKVRQAEQKTAQEVAKTAEAQERVRTQIEKTKNAQKGYASSVFQTKEYLSSTEKIMRTISQLTGVAFSAIGLRRFLESLIEITGHFEVQRMALRNMLQDIDGADKIFEDLYRFSSDSTYRFSELAKYAKQLAAFDIDQNNLLETTKMLGDVASGVGVSMDRLILAYGHVKSSGFLRGIQLRSFSQNGVPILEELSKMFTEVEGKAVSLGDVFDKMTKREIPFEMVEEAFRRMTSEGGKFYQMQEVLAKTLAGQINILKGRWENLLAAIGQSNSGVLKDTVAWMSNLVSSTENVGKLLTEVGVAFGAYKAAVLLATIVTEGFGTVLLNVGIALEKFYLKLMNNPYAIIGAAAAAAGVVIYQYATAVSDADKITQTAEKGIANFNSALVAEQAELDRLYAKLRLAEEGTDEYARAKNEIYNRFGPYIQQLHEEGVAVDNLASIYENLTAKIQDSIKAKFQESESSALQKSLDNATNNIYESFKKTADASGWSIQQQEDIWRYIVTGELKDKSLTNELKRSGGGTIGLPGTFLYKDFGQSAESLRALMSDAFGSFNTSMGQISETFKTETNETKETIKDIDADAKGWRGAVQKAIEGLDASTLKKTGLSPKQDEEYYEYIERVGKRSQELTKERDLALKSEKQEKENLLSAIKTVDKALEGNILKDARYTKTPWNGSGSTNDPNRDKRNEIKASISLLEKFKAAYDKLEPIMGADAARAWVFNNMGHDVSKLDEEFEKLIADLAKLGDEGKRDADAIEARLGLDDASKAAKEYKKTQSALDKRQKNIEKFQKELNTWEKEWGGKYSGFNATVEKEFLKYTNEDKKIDDDYIDALNKAFDAYNDDTEALKKYTDQLYEYYLARKKANEESGKQSAEKLVSGYVKEATSGMSLKDWGDKSIKQVYDIWQRLKALRDEEIVDGLLVGDDEEFANMTFEKFSELTDEAKEEYLKKLGSLVKEVAGDFKDAASSAREYAEATGDMDTAATIDDIMALGDAISDVAARALNGDWIGAVTAGLSFFVKSLYESRIEAAKLEASLRELREQARVEQYKSALSLGVDSIFGTNDLQKVQNAVGVIDKVRESMSKYASIEFNTTKKGFWERFFSSTERAATGGSVFNKASIEELAKSVGGDLYDTYKNLNADTLQSILDTYENLDSEQREWLQHAIDDSEAYADAMKQVEDVAESILGNIVSDVASKMVDSWWEAGEAALDYKDILGDVAKAYAKLIVQDMLMDAAFDGPKREQFINALKSGDASTAMAVVNQAMQIATDMLPTVNAALQAFEPYRNMAQSGTDSSSNSVGAGFKSFTEETASLLASYINAIRADVSYIRVMQEKGWSGISTIGESMPTLNDYLNQVAANTHDTAQNTQSILSELQSVIGAPGTSGMVVRVESY